MAILQAVRDLLREGTDPTRDRIAARADVAPATVYNLVGDRTRLWAALAEDVMDTLARRLAGAMKGDAVEQLRRIVDITVDLMLEDPKVSARMLRGWEESGVFLRRSPMTEIVAALDAARATGFIADDVDTRLVAASISMGCVGAVHQWAAGQGGDAKLRERARLAVDIALAAAAAPEHHARMRGALHRKPTRGRK